MNLEGVNLTDNKYTSLLPDVFVPHQPSLLAKFSRLTLKQIIKTTFSLEISDSREQNKTKYNFSQQKHILRK